MDRGPRKAAPPLTASDFRWCAEQLRSLTKSCLEENMADTAAYYADKLVTFSNFDREAVLLLAKVSVAERKPRECSPWRD